MKKTKEIINSADINSSGSQDYEIKKLQTLLDISFSLNQANTFEDIGKAIHENLVKFRTGDVFFSKLGVYDSSADIYRIIYQSSTSTEVFKKFGFPTYHPFSINSIGYYSQIAVKERKTLLILDNHSDYSLSIDMRQKEFPEQSMVYIPMFYHDTFVGLFSLAREPKNSLDSDFVNFLESIANYASIKINDLLREENQMIIKKNIIENEERWQFALEGSGAGVWDWNVQTNEVLFSKHWKEMLGYEDHEIQNDLEEWKSRVHPDDLEMVYKLINEHFEKREGIYICEHRVLCKDGTFKWILDRGKVMSWTEDGKPLRMVGTHTDISERKKQEERLVRIKLEQQAILENLPFSVWLKDASCTFLAVNKIFGEACGYPPEYIIGKTDFDIFPYETAKKYRKGDEDFIKNKKPLSFEDKVIIEGKEVWQEIFMSPVFDEHGDIIATTGLTRDITERKLSEEAIRKSEEQLRLITDNMVDVISRVNQDSIVVFVSPSIRKVFGYEINDILGKNAFELINPDHSGKLIETINSSILNKEHSIRTEYQFKCKNGEYIWIESEINILYDLNGINTGAVVGSRDIDKRKKAEIALVESEERFRRVTENTMEIIFGYSLIANSFEYISPVVKEVFGYSREEFYGSPNLLIKIISPEWLEYLNEQLRNISMGTALPTLEYQIIHKSGEIKWINQKNVLIFDEEGNPVALEGVAADVTDIKSAVENLAAEKERLAVTLRSIGDGVITTDIEGRVILLNRVAEELTGYTIEDALGKNITEVFNIVNQSTKIKCDSPIENILKTGGIIGIENHTVLISRDGKERVISDSGAPIRDKESKIIGFVIVFRDITDQERMEEEIKKKQKLESVGILAGGIAHDFNNFLTAVLGNLQIARLKSGQSAIDKYLLDAEKATLRAKGLTQQLLTFSAGGAPVIKTGSIIELLKDTVQFTLRGSSISCEYDLPDNLWMVQMDEGQISQVVQNIVLNSKEAMPLGGKIKIVAENQQIKGNNLFNLLPGDCIKVSISDKGMGIPKEHLPRIFDPYFTTKECGHGLGLAICYSIIVNHNGYITVQSEIEKGTKFTFYLPAVQAASGTEFNEIQRVRSGTGRVLVMDDDEMVSEIAKSILEELGYNVVLSKDGSEAVQKYKKSFDEGDPFNIVILDLTVPGGIGGQEAMTRLLEVDPKTVGVVSSGYSNDPILSDYKKFGFSGAIVKPYQIIELSSLMNKLVNSEKHLR